MARPSRTLTGTISDRVHREYEKLEKKDDIVNSISMPIYEALWFKVAEEVYAEFEKEGLVNTCEKVREIIDFNKKCASTKEKVS